MENSEEILQRMEKRLINLEDQTKKRRTASIIIWCCILAALVVAAVLLMPKISAFVEGYNNSLVIIDDVVKSLEGVDTEALSDTLQAISEVDTEKLQSLVQTVNDISGALDQFKDLFA